MTLKHKQNKILEEGVVLPFKNPTNAQFGHLEEITREEAKTLRDQIKAEKKKRFEEKKMKAEEESRKAQADYWKNKNESLKKELKDKGKKVGTLKDTLKYEEPLQKDITKKIVKEDQFFRILSENGIDFGKGFIEEFYLIEEDLNNMKLTLVNSLFDAIKKKKNTIDDDKIKRSAGDVTKFDGYYYLKDALAFSETLCKEKNSRDLLEDRKSVV